MKKNILLFNGYYTPAKNYGGPTTSAENIVNSCSHLYNFFIVVANHDLGANDIFNNIHDGWNKVGLASVLYVNSRSYAFSPKKISALIKETNASLVCIAGIISPEYVWASIFASKKQRIPVLISPRGEVCENAFSMKKGKKTLYSFVVNTFGLFRNVYFHSTSVEETTGLMKYFKIKLEMIYFAPNISKPISQLTKKFKEEGKIRLVFISRIQRKKNLLYSISIVNDLVCDVDFDIYGPIESPDYWKKCDELIRKAPKNVKYRYCGILDPTVVGDTFSKYDCFLFTTISENYGHVIAEAISNGCPVILSKSTTPWDDLDNQAGFVVDLAEPVVFKNVINKIAQMDNLEYTNLVQSTMKYFVNKMSENDAVQKHLDMYRNVIEKF